MHCSAQVDGVAKRRKLRNSAREFSTISKLVGMQMLKFPTKFPTQGTRILVNLVVNNLKWSKTLGGTTKLQRKREKWSCEGEGVLG